MDKAAARKRFPAGLEQPASAYRFGMDALFLGACAARIAREMTARRKREFIPRLVEAGCGSGGALLLAAMLVPSVCLGVDSEESLIAAARNNAASLGLESNVEFMRADLAERGFFSHFEAWGGKCQVALANPPWLEAGAGGLPKTPLRQKALCSASGGLSLFCARASGFLETRGFFCCILPPRMLTAFCKAVESADLGLRQILPLASHAGESAKRMLLVCRKNLRPDPEVLAPLNLHHADGSWTAEALAFCPIHKTSFSSLEAP